MVWLLTIMLMNDKNWVQEVATIELETAQQCQETADNVLKLYDQLGVKAEAECAYVYMGP